MEKLDECWIQSLDRVEVDWVVGILSHCLPPLDFYYCHQMESAVDLAAAVVQLQPQ